MISNRELWILQNSDIKIVFAALVSAGKTTLLNALIGKDLFPMASSSCTTKITGLRGTNDGRASGAQWHFDDHTYGSARNVSKDLFNRFNADPRSGELVFNSSLYGIKNTVFPYLIVDTPGINDSTISFRSEVTIDFLKRIRKALVVYVGSVKHVGTTDEERFFQMLSLLLGEHPQLQWMIALNRMDTLNRSYECIADFMDVEYRLAEKCGLPRPQIYPVSALGALLCRRVLAQEGLTQDEYDEFDRVIRYFGKELPGIDEEQLPDIELYGDRYSSSQIIQVCSRTGILELEQAIFSYIEEK